MRDTSGDDHRNFVELVAWGTIDDVCKELDSLMGHSTLVAVMYHGRIGRTEETIDGSVWYDLLSRYSVATCSQTWLNRSMSLIWNIKRRDIAAPNFFWQVVWMDSQTSELQYSMMCYRARRNAAQFDHRLQSIHGLYTSKETMYKTFRPHISVINRKKIVDEETTVCIIRHNERTIHALRTGSISFFYSSRLP